MANDIRNPAPAGDVAAFLAKVAATPQTRPAGRRGRLIFSLDATASRQPAWDRAVAIQTDMFAATEALGGLDVQLVYFRGLGECRASRWYGDGAQLGAAMRQIHCAAGSTQIGKVLRHALDANAERRVNATVYVGDAMEENAEELAGLAGRLGLLGVPVFVFHEGGDALAGDCFRRIAKLSGGAYCPFDFSSADLLRQLLAAVAVFAAGGRAALADHSRTANAAVRRLTAQLG